MNLPTGRQARMNTDRTKGKNQIDPKQNPPKQNQSKSTKTKSKQDPPFVGRGGREEWGTRKGKQQINIKGLTQRSQRNHRGHGDGEKVFYGLRVGQPRIAP